MLQFYLDALVVEAARSKLKLSTSESPLDSSMHLVDIQWLEQFADSIVDSVWASPNEEDMRSARSSVDPSGIEQYQYCICREGKCVIDMVYAS